MSLEDLKHWMNNSPKHCKNHESTMQLRKPFSNIENLHPLGEIGNKNVNALVDMGNNNNKLSSR